jgi:hypothetical protein
MNRSTEEFLAGTVPATHTPGCGGWRRSSCNVGTELDAVTPDTRRRRTGPHTASGGRTRFRRSSPSSCWPRRSRYWWAVPVPERSATGRRVAPLARRRRHGGTTGGITRHTTRRLARALRRPRRAAPPVTPHHPRRRPQHRRLRRRPRLRPRRRPLHRPLRPRRRSTRRARHTTQPTPGWPGTAWPHQA